MPDAADTKPKMGHEMSEAATNLLCSMLSGLLIMCVMCFGDKYWQKVSALSRPVRRCIGRVLASLLSNIPFVGDYFGAESQQKLLFVPDADNEPDVDHEISEPVLFRFLLNEETLKQLDQAEIPAMLNVLKGVDKESKIVEFETHQSSMGSATDLKRAFHVFIVFKTTRETDRDYWWSLEKNRDYIVLQRSRNKDNVKNQCYGETRHQAKPIVENLKGKGTIKDLFEILWAQQVIPEKYNVLYSNCQSLVTFVSQQITEIGYEYQGYFAYSSPPENGRNKKMLDLINILRGQSDWPPLFALIVMENIHLVGKMIDSGKYDINALYNGLTPLHFAIRFSKNKMVQYLLNSPLNADPTKSDPFGRSALLFAAMFTMKAEIFDSLLAHSKVKVDDADEDGRTALHWAASVSNVVAVQKLLENGANPNIIDKESQSPLHVAARQRDDYEIMDLLLAHDKVKVDDVDGKGRTALHVAVYASNVMAVKHLINKGANVNSFDKEGLCPLYVAALQRDGNPIIDLLLEAKQVKGIGDVNDRNEDGRTALHLAASSSNEITAEHLIQKGADLHCRDNDGITPLHVAAVGATDVKIIDLLLQNIKEEDIEQYRNNKRLFFNAMHNVHGLDMEIGERFLIKGITPWRPETADECWTEESDDEATGVNTRHFLDKGNNPSIDLMKFYGRRMAGAKNSQEIDEILNEEEFADINGRDQNGQTCLFFAIRDNNVNAVRRLLERGADPTIRDNKGLIPFLLAAGRFDRNSEILNLLLASEKVDINETTSPQGLTALHMAIVNSNLTAARYLLSKGANPNVADNGGLTPLHWVARKAKDMDIVELLLSHKEVDVNCLDNLGRNVLHYAMNNKKGQGERIANHLKEKGAVERDKTLFEENRRFNESMKKHMRFFSNQKPRKVDNFLIDDRNSIEAKIDKIISAEYLVSAIKDSDVQNVRLLLKNGADISTWGEYEGNALHWSSFHAKTTDLIGVVLEMGEFDINGVDNGGNTPLHYAIAGSNAATNARYLLEKGAHPTIGDNKGNTPLHFAASQHAKEIETIKLILENQQVDINHINKVGATALHYAIGAKNVEIARCLLERGADPTVSDEDGDTPFHLAAQFLTDTHVFDLMLANEKQIDFDERNNKRSTALHMAMTTSNVTSARILLSNGANTNVVDRDGRTPLHLAAWLAKDMDIVELLLNHKDVDVNCLDIKGKNALDFGKRNMHGNGERIAKLLKEKGLVSQTGTCLNDGKAKNEAKFENNVKGILQKAFVDSEVGATCFLIQTGADISTVTWGEEGLNALHAASILAKTTEILDVILATGQFDINGRNGNAGGTALHFALVASNVTNVCYLLKKGADPTMSDNKGITPLHLAAYFATTTDMIKLILKDGQVYIDGRDVNGMTALYYAILASNVITARYLLKKGADPTTRDNDGSTLFHTAAMLSKDNDVFDLMLRGEKKIDVDKVNESGLTALHLAIKTSNVTAARFLLSNGANPNVADVNGRTPLHWASFLAKDMDIVELLLKHQEVNVNYLDNCGRNALNYAKYNQHAQNERIANRLKEKGAVRVEQEICQDNLFDECSGSDEAIGNLSDNNDKAKNEDETKNFREAPLGIIFVDSNLEKARLLIKKGRAGLGKGKWGNHVMNALYSASRYAKATDPIAILLETDLYVPTAPKCTSDDSNENMVKTVLQEAIAHSDVEKVRILIEMGAELSKVTWGGGRNALHAASVYPKTTEILDVILATGEFDINCRNKDGWTPLQYAILASNVETARYLLENGADPTIGDNEGTTPFHTAASCVQESEILNLFLANDDTFDIDHRNQPGMTAFHMAIKVSNIAAARILLSKGANPNAAEIKGLTPLHSAAIVAKDMDIVKLLVNHKDVNVNCLDKLGNNALHCAKYNKHGLGEAIANLLRGKMASKAEGSNYKPENIAALVPTGHIKEDSDIKTIRLLIENGQDVSAMTWGENGANALHLAAAHEKTTDLIDAILETGKFDINGVDNDGRTPLHYAINKPHPVTINARRLIKMGAEPGIADKNGVTPLHMAARNAETMDLIELLLNSEAVDVNCVDIKGRTPLDCAQDNKHGLGQRIIARLREYHENE